MATSVTWSAEWEKLLSHVFQTSPILQASRLLLVLQQCKLAGMDLDFPLSSSHAVDVAGAFDSLQRAKKALVAAMTAESEAEAKRKACELEVYKLSVALSDVLKMNDDSATLPVSAETEHTNKTLDTWKAMSTPAFDQLLSQDAHGKKEEAVNGSTTTQVPAQQAADEKPPAESTQPAVSAWLMTLLGPCPWHASDNRGHLAEPCTVTTRWPASQFAREPYVGDELTYHGYLLPSGKVTGELKMLPDWTNEQVLNAVADAAETVRASGDHRNVLVVVRAEQPSADHWCVFWFADGKQTQNVEAEAPLANQLLLDFLKAHQGCKAAVVYLHYNTVPPVF